MGELWDQKIRAVGYSPSMDFIFLFTKVIISVVEHVLHGCYKEFEVTENTAVGT